MDGQSSHIEDRRLIDGLLRPEAYPHPVGELRLLETHISWVILTGDFAYKIKKPVRFNFVDYSTLEARHRYCDEELRLNRRFAPELYLDVVPIAGPPNACRIGGDGAPCEFAVRMRQFDQETLLEPAMVRGAVPLEEFASFGRRLAEFHSAIAGAPVPEGLGTPARIAKSVSDVWEILRAQAGAEMLPLVEELDEWRQAEERRLGGFFLRRRQAGFVRECHGDLHLGNLLLLNDEIVAFDGIEFNAALRWIDVLSEVAFLVADLEAFGRRDAAFTFLNAYLEKTGDYEALIALPYYMAYRAAVRAGVTLLRASQIEEIANAKSARSIAERYLRAASACRRRAQPTLTITHGLSGSGKTFNTSKLLAAEGSIRLRSDVERKRLIGLQPTERAGSANYAPEMTAAVYRRLAELAERILQAGFSVVVDATFLRREQREQFELLAGWCGAPWRILDCQAPLEVLQSRVRERAINNLDASDATLDVLESQRLADEPLDDHERAHCLRL